MDFKHLETFIQVVKLRSFSKAADTLFLTQPSVSTHIALLEEELGEPLLIRTPRAIFPTDVGQELYAYAIQMLELRDRAIHLCDTPSRNFRGTINLAASSIPYLYALPSYLTAFRREYPDIHFKVTCCDSAEVVGKVETGKIDLGLAGTVVHSTVCGFERFMDDELVVVIPNQGAYRFLQRFRTEDIIKYPFVIREPGSGTQQEMIMFLQELGISPNKLEIVAQMDSPDGIKQSIAQGLGISIMSSLSVADYEQFDLVKVFRLEGIEKKRSLHVVSHNTRPLSDAATVFKKYVLNAGPPKAVAQTKNADLPMLKSI